MTNTSLSLSPARRREMAQIESEIAAADAVLATHEQQDSAEQTLPEYETDVVDALAALIECTYGEASSIAEIHVDIVEAGYEERERPSVIARELDAQSRVIGLPSVPTMPQLQQAQANAGTTPAVSLVAAKPVAIEKAAGKYRVLVSYRGSTLGQCHVWVRANGLLEFAAESLGRLFDALPTSAESTLGHYSPDRFEAIRSAVEQAMRPGLDGYRAALGDQITYATPVQQQQQACAGRAQVRATARARKDIMEALVEFGSAQADIASGRSLRLVGATNQSGLLARAQARADAYAELLEPILETRMQGGTPAEVDAAVEAVCESLIGAFVGARA